MRKAYDLKELAEEIVDNLMGSKDFAESVEETARSLKLTNKQASDLYDLVAKSI